ncbi:hypothetical protein [Rothia uropygialis]|uniref:hypothetical protein n=1 Tax=Kocuria sp. 36 TaxID=1415402 RepID=UPI00101D132F|nr:hypothetical protein [Kocuria sp. 36]
MVTNKDSDRATTAPPAEAATTELRSGRPTRAEVEHPPGHVDGRLFSRKNHPTVLRTDFDVEAYVAGARGRISVDVEAVVLDDGLVRDLDFLWKLENAALSETRAMLASWTANEARITAFITAWGYERYWLAHALRELVDSSSSERGPREPRSPATKLRSLWVERALPVVAPVVGNVVKEPITAGHMARMAIQEGALQVAESALIPRLEGEARRVMSELVGRREELLRFFRTEALARITRSRPEALSARAHLTRPWAPLRVVGVPQPDEIEALASIFAHSIDRQKLANSDAVIGRHLPLDPQPSVDQVHATLRRARRAIAQGRNHHGI